MQFFFRPDDGHVDATFEVTYNGQFVWSKIEAGRFPQMDELRDALAAVGVTNTPP